MSLKSSEKSPRSRFIAVKHQFEGFHSYPDAPDKVAFLRNNHRHIFKVKATIEVSHNDRDLEFFLVKDVLVNQICAYIGLRSNLGSCESIAEGILEGLENAYGKLRGIAVEVSEDGENSATVWNRL